MQMMDGIPEYRGVWDSETAAYAARTRASLLTKLQESFSEDAHWRVTDNLQHGIDFVQAAKDQKDHEMVFIYGDWLLRGAPAVSVRTTTHILRKHNDGAVRHLVTAARIDACMQIKDGLLRRGRTNWENNEACAYLAFDDPTLVPKIMYLIDQGLFAVEDIRDRLSLMEGIPLSLADGAL